MKICQPGELPGMPNHDRILVQTDVPKAKSEGGLHIPDSAKVRASFGFIMAAGLDARDKMYDNGHELGDYIWFGKFAGVIEEWDHYSILPAGTGWRTCPHDWVSMPAADLCRGFRCNTCMVERVQEPIIVMSVDDILLNETLGERITAGLVRIRRDRGRDGTLHVIDRDPAPVTNGTTTTTLEVSNVAA